MYSIFLHYGRAEKNMQVIRICTVCKAAWQWTAVLIDSCKRFGFTIPTTITPILLTCASQTSKQTDGKQLMKCTIEQEMQLWLCHQSSDCLSNHRYHRPLKCHDKKSRLFSSREKIRTNLTTIIAIFGPKMQMSTQSQIAALALFRTTVTKYQHFFRTNVQIQDFSGPDFSFFILQDFSGPVGTLVSL